MADLSFFYRNKPMTLQQIASVCGGKLRLASPGTADEIKIFDLATVQDAKEGEVCFLQNPKYRKYLAGCQASLILIGEKFAADAPQNLNLLICDDPYYAWAILSVTFYPFEVKPAGIDATAVIASTAKIAATAYIGPNVVIEDNVTIGENTQIHAGSFIGKSTQIGNQCVIHSNCSITYTIMGHLNVIHNGACIGQDGFGFAMSAKGHKYVRQLGRVIIGNDVNIGANTTIDRGASSDTIIEDGVRIDNLVQIAHNVRIGMGSVIAAHVGIAGSTTLGMGVVVAGFAAIAGHIHLGDRAVILANSGIHKDVPAGETMASAIPALPAKQHWRRMHTLQKIMKYLQEK
ncbi:MAG: UDP-3-O-(3-hydroxymyristoyl)glucosamine N-acyltransferase [Alphaproteobacteria bacterium]